MFYSEIQYEDKEKRTFKHKRKMCIYPKDCFRNQTSSFFSYKRRSETLIIVNH